MDEPIELTDEQRRAAWREFSRKGGSVSSLRKTQAARENARKPRPNRKARAARPRSTSKPTP